MAPRRRAEMFCLAKEHLATQASPWVSRACGTGCSREPPHLEAGQNTLLKNKAKIIVVWGQGVGHRSSCPLGLLRGGVECDKGRLGGWTQAAGLQGRVLYLLEVVVVGPRGAPGDPRSWHRGAQGDPSWINHGQRQWVVGVSAPLPSELVVRLGEGPDASTG